MCTNLGTRHKQSLRDWHILFYHPYREYYNLYEIVDRNQSEMRIEGCNQVIHTNVKGQYNMENAASVACVLKSLGYQEEEIAKAIGMFTGINRRFELIGTNHGLLIYDDYAHHPTAIRTHCMQ